MKNRIELYEKAIQELEQIELKRARLINLQQKLDIGVEIVLFAGMVTAIFFLIELTPAFF